MFSDRTLRHFKEDPTLRQLIKEMIETILLALLLFVLMEFSVQNFKVEGSSMRPTLAQDQYLLVNKIIYARVGLDDLAPFIPFVHASQNGAERSMFAFHPPERGEVVIFHFPRDPTRDFVKRVIGVPGDTIEIRRGEVFRNGEYVEEPFITEPSTRSYDPVYVRDGHYYVLGDNRRSSNDSRDWGLVPEQNMVGRAWMRYWPLDSLGSID